MIKGWNTPQQCQSHGLEELPLVAKCQSKSANFGSSRLTNFTENHIAYESMDTDLDDDSIQMEDIKHI